ncbi:PQQ-binding-like beta-propeller repeat protein [Micromonospora sp. URMC 106]|uniref:outer membrane protein assembly factor BamB family protein n=1 Tax=Micromonospora sp. URMC 106 TaxID=3423408 RepID=UPI003F1E18BB
MGSISVPYGNSGNTGECPGPGVSANPAIRWRFVADDTVEWAPTIADGVAYFSDASGTVYAVDAETGLLGWRWQEDDPIGAAAPVAVSDELVIVEYEEVGFAIDRATGKLRWTLDPMERPFIVDDLLVTVSIDGIRAYQLDTREVRWEAAVSSPDFGLLEGRPAVADGLILVTGGFEGNHSHGGLAAVDQKTGRVVWEIGSEYAPCPHGYPGGKEWVTIDPYHAAVARSLVWVPTSRWHDEATSEFAAYEVRTGREHWRLAPPWAGKGEAVSGALVVSADLLYCQYDRTRLDAVDPATESRRFSYHVEHPITGTPVLAGGILHVATEDGALTAIDATTGTLIWTTTADAEETDWAEYEFNEYREQAPQFTLFDDGIYLRRRNTVIALG